LIGNGVVISAFDVVFSDLDGFAHSLSVAHSITHCTAIT
jgi:hypothetical protein